MVTLAALALSAAFVGTAFAQIEGEIQKVRTRLESAEVANLPLIAPESYRRASEKLEDAQKRFEKGGKIEQIRERLQEARTSLDSGEKLLEVGTVMFRDALAARSDAMTSDASDLCPDEWSLAEAAMIEAGEKLEDGDQKAAARNSERARGLFRDAELLAIRTSVLQEAWNARAEASAVKAEQQASATFVRADEYLGAAEKVLGGDRYKAAEASRLAASATEEFRHARLIADQVALMDRDRKSAPEQVIRGYESEIARIATVVGVEPVFSTGAAAVTREVAGSVKSILEENRRLEAEVARLQQQLAATSDRVGTLESRDAMLQQREQHEQVLQEVRGMYTAGEAEVLLRGETLIVRLYGLSFPVGSSEIRPENFSLLSKVRATIDEFPAGAVTVEGHTDSSGDSARNLLLSEERAMAVRTYLLANMTVAPERIAAVGYGESRPIANNESEEGRAKNRRIDLTIDLAAS
jgi:outer membrane protein OmpA-like peptidoglycan-associated protein